MNCNTLADYISTIDRAGAHIKAKFGECDICVVLGSGLNSFADVAFGEDRVEIPYPEIPGMPGTSVAGHYGKVICGNMGDKKVLCFAGRLHSYEGFNGPIVTLLPRVARACGCKIYILTNAAGGVLKGMVPGCGMIIEDHMNVAMWNPMLSTERVSSLQNPVLNEMKQPIYSTRLAGLVEKLADDIKFPMYKGSYAWFSGPSYETPAEIATFGLQLGLGTIGMSSVPEAQAAAALGMEVFGLSLVTNLAAGLSDEVLTHEEVSIVAKKASDSVQHIIGELVRNVEILPETIENVREIAISEEEREAFAKVEINTVENLPAAVAKGDLLSKIKELSTGLVVVCPPCTKLNADATVGEINLTKVGSALAVTFPRFECLTSEVAFQIASAGSKVVMVTPVAKGEASEPTADFVTFQSTTVHGAVTHVAPEAKTTTEGPNPIAFFPAPSWPGKYAHSLAERVGCTDVTIMPANIPVFCLQTGVEYVLYPVACGNKVDEAFLSGLEIAPATTEVVKSETAVAADNEIYNLYDPHQVSVEEAKKYAEELKTKYPGIETSKVVITTVDGLKVEGAVALRIESPAVANKTNAEYAKVFAALAVLGVKKVGYVGHISAYTTEATPEFVRIKDHVNLTGENPLRGHNVDEYGVRFPDMGTIYESNGESVNALISFRTKFSPSELKFYAENLNCTVVAGAGDMFHCIALAHSGIKVVGGLCASGEVSVESIVEAL